jgi:hypothetical protein
MHTSIKSVRFNMGAFESVAATGGKFCGFFNDCAGKFYTLL